MLLFATHPVHTEAASVYYQNVASQIMHLQTELCTLSVIVTSLIPLSSLNVMSCAENMQPASAALLIASCEP